MSDMFAWLQDSALATWVREGPTMAYPTVLTLHTFGLMVMVGMSFTLALRVLGVAPRIPLKPMRALFPLVWGGLWINLGTGLLLFATDAVDKSGSALFAVKLLLVAAGVATMVLLERRVYSSDVECAKVSPSARLLAAESVVVWTGAVTAGRLLAYL